MISSMRQVGVMAAYRLRRVALDGALIWLVLMPLAIIYVLAITMHGLFSTEFTPAKPYHIVVAAEGTSAPAGTTLPSDGQAQTATGEASERAQGIVQQLSKSPAFFAVKLAADGNEARRAVLEREADAAVVVTGADSPLTLIAMPGSVVGEALAGWLHRYDLGASRELGELSTGGVSGDGGDEAAAVPETPWVGVGAFQYFSVAIMIMFIMFASHSAMIYSVADHATGAYLRIRALGISRSTYLVAGVASAGLVGFVFALAMTVITGVLFRVDWGDPLAWVFVTVCGALSIAALSFLITAVLPKNPKSVESAGGTVYTILSFLGGSTVPLAVMPDWFARIFSWLPNRRLLDGYLAIAAGADLATLAPDFLGLGAMTLALFALSWLIIKVFKREGA